MLSLSLQDVRHDTGRKESQQVREGTCILLWGVNENQAHRIFCLFLSTLIVKVRGSSFFKGISPDPHQAHSMSVHRRNRELRGHYDTSAHTCHRSALKSSCTLHFSDKVRRNNLDRHGSIDDPGAGDFFPPCVTQNPLYSKRDNLS